MSITIYYYVLLLSITMYITIVMLLNIYCFDSAQPLVILQNYATKINKERYCFCFRLVVFVYIYKIICNTFFVDSIVFQRSKAYVTKTVSVQKFRLHYCTQTGL